MLPRGPRSAAVTWDGRTEADIRSDMPKAKRTIRLAILDSAHDDAREVSTKPVQRPYAATKAPV